MQGDDETTPAADETESVSDFESESDHEAAIERQQEGRRYIQGPVRRPLFNDLRARREAKAGGEDGVIGESPRINSDNGGTAGKEGAGTRRVRGSQGAYFH